MPTIHSRRRTRRLDESFELRDDVVDASNRTARCLTRHIRPDGKLNEVHEVRMWGR